MRTLSVRIMLAFAAVIVTFGITTAVVLVYLNNFGVEIGVIKTGYLPLALGAKDFASRQEDLRAYLAEDFKDEASVRNAARTLSRYRRERDKTLRDTLTVLHSMTEVPQRHQKRLADAATQLQAISDEIEVTAKSYALLLLAPPLVINADNNDENRSSAAAALKTLIDQEKGINVRTGKLAEYLKSLVTKSASNLEDNEQNLRLYTIAWAGGAILLGILLSVWASLALRPLRRLRDAAGQIAAGDYGNRIEERGPKEVVDLAREFNSMGRAVQDRERELVRSERLVAVGKMAQLITHEIRNPLSSIGLNTELLEEELGQLPASAEAKELCAAINREIDRLTAITEDYLQMGRLPKPKLQRQEVFPIVAALVDFVREDVQSRGVMLSLTPGPSSMVVANLDSGQLRQCLLNLIRNAADAVAGQADAHVELSVNSNRQWVEILVIDNGPGINPEDRLRVFDPFFSTKKGGSGLGLALTQQIIRDHAGELTVTPTGARASNIAAHGATFMIRLPVLDHA
jgi:two-component system, NtrC family, sensor kinase